METTMPNRAERSLRIWQGVQIAVWLLGAGLLVALVVAPKVGIAALWNALIPIAPALLVFAPGLWRNICPLSTTALLAHRTGLSNARTLTPATQAWLNLVGVLALLLIVPLRHVILNVDGPATALTLVTVAVVAILMGVAFDSKSAWCSGLCPVHPVERLYGSRPLVTMPNAHCVRCYQCSSPCPDSVPSIHPLSGLRTSARTTAGTLLAGGFAGFVWGWFQVPDGATIARAYGLPLAGLAATLMAYLGLRRLWGPQREALLIRLFAAAAVGCYYWYRVPALFGFGMFAEDGLLVDLRSVLPEWFPIASRIVTSLLFFGWFAFRSNDRRSWCARPPYATTAPSLPNLRPGEIPL